MVDDWKECYRWFSVQLAAVLAALPIVWAGLSDELRAMVPETWHPYVVSAIAIGVIIGRLKAQPTKAGASK